MALFGLGKYSQRSLNRAEAALGLRPATHAEKYGEFAELKFNVELMPEQGRLSELEPLFREAWESKDRLPNTDRVYSSMLGWAEVERPDEVSELDEFLDPYVTEYSRNPTSFTAALYAEALHSAAFVARGTAYAHQTSSAQFAGMRSLTEHARAVLESIPDVADDDFAWWSARHSLTQTDGSSKKTRGQIFDHLTAIDPGNFDVVGRAMLMALPRWYGTDEYDADRVARRAMEANREHWGAGGYAIAYWELTSTGGLAAEDTAIDVALAEQGFRDLLDRVPSISLRNRFAKLMSWSCVESVVTEIFDYGPRVVDPYAWWADSDEEGMDLAVRAYVWAKHNS